MYMLVRADVVGENGQDSQRTEEMDMLLCMPEISGLWAQLVHSQLDI